MLFSKVLVFVASQVMSVCFVILKVSFPPQAQHSLVSAAVKYVPTYYYLPSLVNYLEFGILSLGIPDNLMLPCM